MDNVCQISKKSKKSKKHEDIELIIEDANHDLGSLSKPQLLEKCKSLGLSGYSSKKKSDLIDMIMNNNESNVVIAKMPISLNTMLPLKPLVKWSGGKSDEIKEFQKYIPDFDTYLEPFIGGGSLFFHLRPAKAVISDVHTELVDFYQSIKAGHANEIYEFMKSRPNDEETYYQVRDKMPINCPLDNAKRFYYLRKTCFRGMLRYNKQGKFNIPYGRYKTINYEELKNPLYEELLKNTEIHKESYQYIFEHCNDANNFMFLDPPYDSEFTDYGYCVFDKEAHKDLFNHFASTKIKCLMVIGKTAFIEDLYKDYIVDKYDKRYKFKLYAGRIGDEINTEHLVIKNY
jgi:DNA adenine methylase